MDLYATTKSEYVKVANGYYGRIYRVLVDALSESLSVQDEDFKQHDFATLWEKIVNKAILLNSRMVNIMKNRYHPKGYKNILQLLHQIYSFRMYLDREYQVFTNEDVAQVCQSMIRKYDHARSLLISFLAEADA